MIVTPADHWRIAEYAASMKNRFPGTGSMQELQLHLSQAAQWMLCPTLTSKKDGHISLGSWLTRHTMQELLAWLLLAGKHTHAKMQLKAFIGKDSQYSNSLFRNEYSTLPQDRSRCSLRAVPVSHLESVKKVYAAD